VDDGFRIATSHLGNILGYAVISATVGVILRAISERGGIIGQIVVGIKKAQRVNLCAFF